MNITIVATLLGIVEGLTEFLPISSTGHLIIADRVFRFQELLASADKAEMFEIVIQLGAVLAVGFLYRARLMSTFSTKSGESQGGRLRLNLIIAFLPAAIIGFLTHHWIKTYLFSPLTVGISLVIGGIIIIWIERRTVEEDREITVDTMTTKDSLVVGLAQSLSLIPGTSRAAATIMGGMLRGIKRSAATEFSFLLAFPTMVAASLFELVKYRHLLTKDVIGIVAIGFITSFVVALAIVAWFIRYVQRHPFTGFGVYRIVFGAAVIALALSGFLS
ncbi:MAG: undecaprenyl-diphosphate phosphatase [Bacteroidota bacterium]|nr:undecaprenyl-diphosphate phosphatase [Bacteroidota bacterium]MDP4232006.1 undecaprenyl-diphosphate phosphatase [Bacteroidota bacterium]MDP4241287.1 undecaprenyl-diphosphate phosphatase [Bacteroidota bacterium]MDP4286679.1 undecaprenyl-diphosphate phosphatase [Bacteroidota bacterium]